MGFGYKLKWEKGRFNPTSSEPYTLSRSKVDRFIECPRCFWLEARYGIGRPDSAPYTLNNAVDELFKREFDTYRKEGKPHPLMEQYGIDAIPFAHKDLEEWRDAFKRGIKHHDVASNLLLRGGIDDVWVAPSGALHIVDYKATAGKDEVTLDDAWKIQYKRQVEVYQWLFRKNGFDVSPIAYFVYANGQNDKPAFLGNLTFDITVLPYEGDDSWVSKTLLEIRTTLDSDRLPKAHADCEYCAYRTHAGKCAMALHKEGKA